MDYASIPPFMPPRMRWPTSPIREIHENKTLIRACISSSPLRRRSHSRKRLVSLPKDTISWLFLSIGRHLYLHQGWTMEQLKQNIRPTFFSVGKYSSDWLSPKQWVNKTEEAHSCHDREEDFFHLD